MRLNRKVRITPIEVACQYLEKNEDPEGFVVQDYGHKGTLGVLAIYFSC